MWKKPKANVDDIARAIQLAIWYDNHERDIVLKVLNTVMNKVGEWKTPSTRPGTATVHPNIFIQRSQERVMQIAMALGHSVGQTSTAAKTATASAIVYWDSV